MNDNHPEATEGAGPEGDAVARLLRLAGPRPAAPTKMLNEIKRSARSAWEAKVREQAERRRRTRAVWQLAAAAAVVLAVGAGLYWQRLAPAGSASRTVATVEILRDAAWLLPTGSEQGAETLTIGAPIPAGTTLATGTDGRMALRLRGGASLRLDADTRLELRSPTELALLAGAVYLDSGAGPETSAGSVEIATPFGVARDIGTQFEVRLAEDGLRVQVREGEVHLEREGVAHPAPAGTALTVRPDGSVERSAVEDHGEAWDWMLTVAPSFELEGRSVGDFLAWVGRETGLEIRYAQPGLEQRVAAMVAHGSVEGLTPAEALEIVLPSSGLDFRIERGSLIVAPTQP